MTTCGLFGGALSGTSGEKRLSKVDGDLTRWLFYKSNWWDVLASGLDLRRFVEGGRGSLFYWEGKENLQGKERAFRSDFLSGGSREDDEA